MLMFVYCACCNNNKVKNVLIQIYEGTSVIRIYVNSLCVEEHYICASLKKKCETLFEKEGGPEFD